MNYWTGPQYWNHRGIEVGDRVSFTPEGSLPGTPPIIGRAAYTSLGIPIVWAHVGTQASGRGRTALHNPDAWQPVNAQERMFQS